MVNSLSSASPLDLGFPTDRETEMNRYIANEVGVGVWSNIEPKTASSSDNQSAQGSTKRRQLTRGLLIHHPVSRDLHPKQRVGIDVSQLGQGSHERLKWQCFKCKYIWQARVASRCSSKKPSGCPFCNRHAKPPLSEHKVYKEVHSEQREGIDVKTLTQGSSEKLKWQCSVCQYVWEAMVKKRCSSKKPSGCPV